MVLEPPGIDVFIAEHLVDADEHVRLEMGAFESKSGSLAGDMVSLLGFSGAWSRWT